jgi:hypothetical protein
MDYSHLQVQYGGQYIATLKGRIIAHGRTFKEVMDRVRSKGKLASPDLSFRFILPQGGICVYCL